MRRGATHLFKRQAAKIKLFSKLSNFYFDLRPLEAEPQARQRSKNPTPRATRMCESPGLVREREDADA